jgi:hypothetical protein
MKVKRLIDEPSLQSFRMPFTAAHPAILVPLKKVPEKYISWTALIIGSMVPDMEYFIWLSSGSFLSHTKMGIFYFDLPMTFLLAFFWQQSAVFVCRKRWPYLKAQYLSQRVEYFPDYLKKHWFKFTVSALIGILTHLAWDSFSHAKGYMAVNVFPVLIEHISVFGIYTRLCYVVWYISTIVGLMVIAAAIFDFKAIFRTRPGNFKNNLIFMLKVELIAIVIGIIRVFMGLDDNIPRHLIIIALGASIYAFALMILFERRKFNA